MNLFQKVFRNSGAIILGNGIDAFAGLLLSIILAKYFGQTDFGKISFLGIFFFLLAVVDSLWLRPVLIREIAKDESRAAIVVGNGLLIRGLLSAGVLLLFWGTFLWAGISREMSLLVLLASFNMLLSPFIFSYEVVFRSCLGMAELVKIKLAGNMVTLLLAGLVIFLKGNLYHFFIASIISATFLFLASRHYAGRVLRPCFEIDKALWRSVFVQGWFLGLSALFIFVYHRVDQIMLFHMQSASTTGVYAAGVRLVEWLQVIPLALMSSLLPLLSSSYSSFPERFEKIYRLSFKYLLIFIIPVAVGASLFPETIVTFFYGKEYALASQSFSILIFAEIFVFLGIVNNTILVAAEKQSLDPIFTGCSVVVNILLNLMLIPCYGLTGAAAASLAAYATGPVMGLFIPATRMYSWSMFYYALRPICASVIMVIFYFYFHFNIFAAAVFLPVIYIVSLYGLNSFHKDEVRLASATFEL